MNPEKKDEVVQLYLDDIIPNRFQPREVFDERALKELAVSIREHGVIQPIIVRNVNGKYEIIAGERRYKASALEGLTKIPAIIRDLDDKESSKVALLENLQRKNLNPIEEARTYQKILEIDQMTQEELAKTMGKSQAAVSNKIRLLTLPEEIQDALLKEQISERHARALLNLDDSKRQKEMLKKVITNKMSVRMLEDEIKAEIKGAQPEQQEEPQDIGPSLSINSFVNNSPLTPTTDLPEIQDNYGKVTIAPPEGESMPADNKFLNYGEIDSDNDTDDDLNDIPLGGGSSSSMSPLTPMDINDIKANTSSINTNNNNNNSSFNNLLNISPSLSNNPLNTDSFITPAEKIVKTDTQVKEKAADYFTTPDLAAVNIATDLPLPNTSGNLTVADSTSGHYSTEDAMEKIRALVTELEQHGVPVKTDEMNFDKSYQIIIKIDKNKE